MSDTGTTVTVPADTEPAPRTLADVEADLMKAIEDAKAVASDKEARVSAYLKKHAEEIEAAAEAEAASLKTEAMAVVQKFEDELHTLHDGWTKLLADFKAMF